MCVKLGGGRIVKYRNVLLSIMMMVTVFWILGSHAFAGNSIPACVAGEVTDDIIDTNTDIKYALYVPTNTAKCKDVVIVFHGWGASEDDYNGIPLYSSLKYNLYNPNAYVCFISKGAGSWATNYEKDELTAFINDIVALTGVSRVHFLGYSQGVYDSMYITSAYNKWTNALCVDGGDFSTKLSKSYKYIIWVAGFDEKSYLDFDEQQYVNEYYEPMCKENFTSGYIFHKKSAIFALTSEGVSKYFDVNVSDYYDYPCIDGVSLLISY